MEALSFEIQWFLVGTFIDLMIFYEENNKNSFEQMLVGLSQSWIKLVICASTGTANELAKLGWT
jgi:hypothetical protein